MSELMVLNVGAGDTKLTFDPKKKAEREHAARVVRDMLKRGYAILVEAGQTTEGEPLYRRATAFDEKTCEYIIVGVPEDVIEEEPEAEASEPKPQPKARRGRKPKERRVPAAGRRAVAVARTAGG